VTGPNNTYRHAGICEETGKRGYIDRATARRNRKATLHRTGEGTARVSVYRCEHCDLFHIGHVAKGDTPR
jgi:hypothetical protein